MGLDELTPFMYSHSDYADVWDAYIVRFNKYKTPYASLHLFIDSKPKKEFQTRDIILYDDKLSYCKRLVHCLKQVSTKYVLYTHEDMILYDKPDWELLGEYVDILENSHFSYIKLLKGGMGLRDLMSGLHPSLRLITNYDWNFSVQPTIWETARLLEVLEDLGKTDPSIWKLEELAQSYMKSRIFGLYAFNGCEKKRGMYHWDSAVYPFIATAIVKGQWNTAEYPKEINDLAEEFNIDLSIRGQYEEVVYG